MLGFFNQNDANKKRKTEGTNRPKWSIVYYVIIVLLLLGIQISVMMSNSSSEVPYSTFRKWLVEGKVESVQVSPTKIYGILKVGAQVVGVKSNTPGERSVTMPNSDNRKFSTLVVKDDELMSLLEKKGVKYEGISDSTWFSELMQWVLPLMILLAIYFFVFRRINPGSQVMNIGKAKASLYETQNKESKTTFKDVAGLDEAKEEVMEVVEFLKDPKKFTKLGGKLPKGVLLVGPPGAGKTLMAKAVAGEAAVPFFSLSGSDFVEMFVGVGAARVRDLFKKAKEKAPCIIFIDEIDAVGRSRGRGMMIGANDERENTLNQLLVEMDGFSTDKGVILMAATNRPDVLDPALLRPGRFDRQIVIDRPDLNGRIEIFNVHLENMPLSKEVNLKVLSSQTSGFAGAEIANVCNEAALLASRRDKEKIEMIDFQDAIERVIAGLEKRNKVINPKEKRVVAYHETGHAIVSWLMGPNDPVQKMSIVPRGISALGYTINLPLEDRYLMTKEELFARICGLLGGRIAEEIAFGEISTGAQNDLERITEIAYSMVMVYGMSDALGFISFTDPSSNSPLLSRRSMTSRRQYSSDTAKLIDSEVKLLIDKASSATRRLLSENKGKLIEMAELLLEREVLNYNDIKEILGERVGNASGADEFVYDVKTNGKSSQEKDKSDVKTALKSKEEERAKLESAVEKIKKKRGKRV